MTSCEGKRSFLDMLREGLCSVPMSSREMLSGVVTSRGDLTTSGSGAGLLGCSSCAL